MAAFVYRLIIIFTNNFMNHKQQPKSRSTQKNKDKKSKKSGTQQVVPWKTEHEVYTKSSTIKELGGFPGYYNWRYGHSATNAPFAIAAQPASMFNLGLNYPTAFTGYGWPTLSLVYDSYVIKRCALYINVFNKSTTVAYRLTICPYNFDELTAYPTATDDQFANNPFAVSVVVGNSGSSNVKLLSNAIDMARLAGLPKIDQANDSYTGYVGGSNSDQVFTKPQQQYRWNVSIQSMDGSTIPATTLYCSFNLIYDIVMFDKLPLGI
jgi:hypothetical protein